MECRVRFFATVLIFLLTVQGASLFAQATSLPVQASPSQAEGGAPGAANAESAASSAEEAEEEEPSFTGDPKKPEESWQILSWEEKNPRAVLKYDVVVESPAGAELRRLEAKRGETSVRIFPLLPPGKYRYKVVTYDLVGIPAAESDWTSFTIYIAHRPEIHSVKSALKHSSTLYLDEYNDGKFSVKGKNLLTPREGKDDLEFTEYALVPKKSLGRTYTPKILSQDPKAGNMEIQFNVDTLNPGVYHFRATDSSGLFTPDSGSNEVVVRYTKPMDLNVSVGYSCPVIMYDDTFKTYMGSNIWPLSGNAKIVFIPIKNSWGYLGFGLSGTYTRMSYDGPFFTIDGNLATANALLVYQRPIKVNSTKDPTGKRHFGTVEVHAGAGAAYFYDFQYHFSLGSTSDTMNSLNGTAVVGAAFQYYFTPRIFVEAQTDFIASFISDMSYGMLIPSLSVGYQF